MKTSESGRKFIEQFEGLFLQAYDDANDRIAKFGEPIHGTLSVGFGHTTAAGPPRVHVGMTITAADADAILSADLAHVEADVNRIVKVSLTQPQYDSLVSFHYNTGWLTHPHCSLLMALNAGNYELADEDFMLYDRANGKVLVGLDRRRRAEAKLFNEGVYEI
jgi:lysozyme